MEDLGQRDHKEGDTPYLSLRESQENTESGDNPDDGDQIGIALADRLASMPTGRRRVASWAPLVGSLEGKPPDDFVNGHWLRSELGLQDGPEMTMALSLVREAEISGEVKSEGDAHNLLLRHYTNMD